MSMASTPRAADTPTLAAASLAGHARRNDGSLSGKPATPREQSLSVAVQSHRAEMVAWVEAGAAVKTIATLAASKEAEYLTIGPHLPLFSDGDPAGCYYLVLSGELLVHRRRDGARPSVRFIGPGDLLMLASAGRREANCHAITAASAVALDCNTLETLAASNAAVRQHLDRVGADERALILADHRAQRDSHREPGAEQPDVSPTITLHPHPDHAKVRPQL